MLHTIIAALAAVCLGLLSLAIYLWQRLGAVRAEHVETLRLYCDLETAHRRLTERFAKLRAAKIETYFGGGSELSRMTEAVICNARPPTIMRSPVEQPSKDRTDPLGPGARSDADELEGRR